MKFNERRGNLYLEDIEAKDIRFANLAGRLTGSIYDDPNRPKREYTIWLEDEEMANKMRDYNFIVKEVNELDRVMRGHNEDRKREVEQDRKLQKELSEITRYSMKLKAYPKIRVNRKTGKEEQYPKVILETTGSKVRLEAGTFGLGDSAHVETIDIKFHPWQYDDRKPDCVAVIDELWCTVDEGAGEIDDSFLDEKHGYSEDDVADEIAAQIDEEEIDVPFA